MIITEIIKGLEHCRNTNRVYIAEYDLSIMRTIRCEHLVSLISRGCTPDDLITVDEIASTATCHISTTTGTATVH